MKFNHEECMQFIKSLILAKRIGYNLYASKSLKHSAKIAYDIVSKHKEHFIHSCLDSDSVIYYYTLNIYNIAKQYCDDCRKIDKIDYPIAIYAVRIRRLYEILRQYEMTKKVLVKYNYTDCESHIKDWIQSAELHLSYIQRESYGLGVDNPFANIELFIISEFIEWAHNLLNKIKERDERER